MLRECLLAVRWGAYGGSGQPLTAHLPPESKQSRAQAKTTTLCGSSTGWCTACSGWPSSSAIYSCPGSLSTTRARWVPPGSHTGLGVLCQGTPPCCLLGARGRLSPLSEEVGPSQGGSAGGGPGSSPGDAECNSHPVPTVRLPVVLHDSGTLERGSYAVSSRHSSTVSKAPRGRGQHRERLQWASSGRGSRNNPGRYVLPGRRAAGLSQPLSACVPARQPLPTFTPAPAPLAAPIRLCPLTVSLSLLRFREPVLQTLARGRALVTPTAALGADRT